MSADSAPYGWPFRRSELRMMAGQLWLSQLEPICP